MDDTDNCDDSHNGIYKDGKHGFSTNISKLAALMMFSSRTLKWPFLEFENLANNI